jgi:hypothetical protein
MVPFIAPVISTLGSCFLLAAPCVAAPVDSSGSYYALITPPSALEVGCQGPCACPIVTSPTYGSFLLVKTSRDPLFTYYAVERYIASFNNGPGAIAITGSGQYKIGGEFALTQQMTLDLDVQGQPTQHFDSGLVPVGAPFPQISVSCAVHGFHCFDSVLVVNAKPVGTAGGPLPRIVAGLEGVSPNPFRSGTRIAFALERPGTVDLTVVDLEGRRVRALTVGQPFGAGPQSVSWDGRRDDGRVAPAGVYWVRLRWPDGADRRRLVKLE